MTHRALLPAVLFLAAACSSSTGTATRPSTSPVTDADASPDADDDRIAAIGEDDPPADLDPSVPPQSISSTDEPAKAVLSSPDGIEGTVTFEPSGAVVLMRAEIRGLTPGKHGFHIHEHGDCASADFSSAGGHFAPRGRSHGGPTADAHHVGDLGNLEVGADGVVSVEQNTDLDLSPDSTDSILGKAIIVHEKADDFESQPSGDAGRRVACGVIAPDA